MVTGYGVKGENKQMNSLWAGVCRFTKEYMNSSITK